MAGNLEFYYGPMDSGKSTRIIQTAHSNRKIGLPTIVAKHRGVGFPGSTRLLQLADKIHEITTHCSNGDCEGEARFHARLVNGVYVSEGSQVAVDDEGSVTYKPVCKKPAILKNKPRL